MKYIQKIGISKKKLVPTGMLLTSILMNNNALFAKSSQHYTLDNFKNTIDVSLQRKDKQHLPKMYNSPKAYYASFPEYTAIKINTKALEPLTLSMRANYLTVSGQGKPGGVENTTAILLDTVDGIQAYKTSVTGNISTTDTVGKLITIKETTITGTGSRAIYLNNNADNTIMLNYSKTGIETTSTVVFTNPNDTTKTHTVTVYSGSDGNIEAGNGDNVVWIGGSPKEGFGWSGQGAGYNGPTTVYGDIRLGNGNNELKIYQRSQVHGDLVLGNGNNVITLDNASIGLIVKDSYTYEFVTIPGMPANGNITLGTGKNTLTADRAEIAGTVRSGTGEDSISLRSSSIFGQLMVQGTGSNTIQLEHSTIYQGLNIQGDANNIEIKGGFIGKPKPYNNDTAVDIYANVTVGGANNTLSLYYLTFGGNVIGNGTIALHSGTIWKGDRTINGGQDVFLYSSTKIDGDVVLASNAVSVELYGGGINGDIGTVGSKIGSLFIKDEKSDDFGSSPGSFLHGDVYLNILDIQKETSIMLEPLYVDPKDTTNPNHTIKPENPIDRVMDINTVALGGDIVLHRGVTGDNLTVRGNIEPNGGSFVLDMNFEEGTHDVLHLENVTINNTVGGENKIVYFIPEKPLYYATLGTVLEGVVQGDASLSVALSQTDVGGYEYELFLNPNNTQWDLRLTRISASNYAYAGILENMRNYTKSLWGSLHNTSMQERIAQHGGEFSIIPNTSTNKRVFKDLGITAWINTNYITNTIYDPMAPTIDEETFIVIGGISTQNIVVNEYNDVTMTVFAGYGDTQSKLNQYGRNHTMQMEAMSLGITGTWNYKGLGKKHTLFTTAGFWVDLISNKVNLEGLDNNTTWNTYSTKGVVSFGYQLQEGAVIFLTSLDGTYNYTKGTSFITKTNNAIDIADDHQLALRANALVGYSFNFGLTPFFQFSMDIPLYALTKGTITSNGHPFRYNSETMNTGFQVGLNYTVSFGEDNLKAYCIFGIHKGQPSTTVEVGFTANAGLSYTF